MTKTATKRRVTLDLTPEFYERLEQLERLVEADSKASVIRQALQLFEYIAKRTRQGDQFRAVTRDGQEETLVFLGPSLPG